MVGTDRERFGVVVSVKCRSDFSTVNECRESSVESREYSVASTRYSQPSTLHSVKTVVVWVDRGLASALVGLAADGGPGPVWETGPVRVLV